MVRRKVELKRIENTASRQVTFTKRRNGLLKKAYELSVLCDAEVALLVFSQKGKLHEFSSSNMQKTIEKYHKRVNNCNAEIEVHPQKLKHKAAVIQQKIEELEVLKRSIMTQDIASCSLHELIEVGTKLESTLITVRARKAQLFIEQIEKLKSKEICLLEENARLCDQVYSMKQKDPIPCSPSSQFPEVETELFVGLRLSQTAGDF